MIGEKERLFPEHIRGCSYLKNQRQFSLSIQGFSFAFKQCYLLTNYSGFDANEPQFFVLQINFEMGKLRKGWEC